jgi:hypothetical protein
VRVTSGTGGDQVDQQPVEPVDGLGAHGDQVLAAVGQQVQHDRVVLDADLPQPRRTLGGDRDRDRIVGVGLAAVAGRQHPDPGGELGRHVHHPLAVSDQLLGHGSADPVGTLDRPAPLRPAPSPLEQALIAGTCGGEALLVQQLAVVVEGGGGMGGLVRVDPDRHWHPGTFLECGWELPGGGVSGAV